MVVDLFGGSGSTLIGMRTDRPKARLVELDPKYAECIVKRWQEYSGKQATLDGDGRTYAELSAERAEVAA